MCGYPICINTIPDMPAKKYHVSSKYNIVYDITERKNYCSNFCYKAGTYIKEQMLTSPLWYRDQEEVPVFQLLPPTETGIPGIEIDQGIVKITDEKDTAVKMDNKTKKNEDAVYIVEKESTKSPPKEENFFYSKMFVPNLADILLENAKYFENLDKVTVDVKESIHVRPADIEIKTGNIVNDKSDDMKLKGILSNRKRQKIKKSVSFGSSFESTVTTVKEKTCLKPNISQNSEKVFKNPVMNHENETQMDDSLKLKKITDKIKNQNTIHNKINENTETDKKKSIESDSKIDNDRIQTMDSETKNITNETTIKQSVNTIDAKQNQVSEKTDTKSEQINADHRKFLSKDSLINKPVIEHKSIIIPNNSTSQVPDTQKEKRKLNLKNSTAYSRITRSKIQIKDQCISKNICMESKLRKCVQEWLTFETIIFLYGEDQVRKVVPDKTFKQYLNLKRNSSRDEVKRKQYNAICKTLNLMELADQKFDETAKEKEIKPLPHYEELKEDADTMDLRVQAFYSGCYEVHEDSDDASEANEIESTCDDSIPDIPIILPLIDSKDLTPIRKKLFLTALNRILPGICEIFHQSPNSLLSSLKQLVDTFELDANNIVFKTAEWPVIAVLLMKIVSIQDKELATALKTKEATEFITSLMKQFTVDEYNLDVLLLKSTQINCFIEDYFKK